MRRFTSTKKNIRNRLVMILLRIPSRSLLLQYSRQTAQQSCTHRVRWVCRNGVQTCLRSMVIGWIIAVSNKLVDINFAYVQYSYTRRHGQTDLYDQYAKHKISVIIIELADKSFNMSSTKRRLFMLVQNLK